MDFNSIQDWALSLIGGGGIGAVITYLATFKSRTRIEKELAKQSIIETEDKHGTMERDRFEAMYNQITEMAKDYNDLSDQFREYRKTALSIENRFEEELRNKSNELAKLKDQVNYLKGLKCYNLECPHRIKNNPENQE